MKTFYIILFSFILIACHPESKKQSNQAETESTSKKEVELVMVKGKILNAIDSTPIESAMIFIPGTSNGTITDGNGNFKLKIPDDVKNLNFAAGGFVTVKEKVDPDKVNLIYLYPQSRK